MNVPVLSNPCSFARFVWDTFWSSLAHTLDVSMPTALQITTNSSDVVFPSALGRRLAKLRGLVFSRTKAAYWNLVLRATIHKTVQPAGG